MIFINWKQSSKMTMIMNFSNFSSAVNAQESSRLVAGIYDVKFNGIELGRIDTKNGPANVLTLKLAGGPLGDDYKTNFFEPTSSERKDGQWGIQASQEDHFMIIIREILEAVNPQFSDDIAAGNLVIGGSFTNIVNTLKAYTTPFIGKDTQIKLVPGTNGYVNVPSYPARITKNGELGIQTRFIGDNLAFTSSEEKKIKAAAVAKPTNMGGSAKSALGLMLDDVKSDLGGDVTTDDMPF